MRNRFSLLLTAVALVGTTSMASAQDAAVVNADKYVVELETDDFRVLRVDYGPMAGSAMHSHPDHLAVMLTDGAWTLTGSDGESTDIEAVAGQVLWVEAGSHEVQSRSDAPIGVIVIEMKGEGDHGYMGAHDDDDDHEDDDDDGDDD